MKRLFTILLISITQPVFSQLEMVVSNNMQFFDIPGPNYLGSLSQNNKLILYDYDYFGSVTWQDTITFSAPNETIHYHYIKEFPNSSEVAIFLIGSKMPAAFDTSRIIQIFKFNIETKTISGGQLDTINSMYIPFKHIVFPTGQSSYNESNNIQLFFPRQKMTYQNPIGQTLEPWIMDENLNLTQICHSDSLLTPDLHNFELFYNEDTLTKYKFSNYGIEGEKYSLDFTNIHPYSATIINLNGNDPRYVYTTQINKDTILGITSEQHFSSTNRFLQFNLFNGNFEIIKEDTASVKFGLKIAAIYHDNLIYTYSLLNSETSADQKIRIFDLNFNEVCSINSGVTGNNSYGFKIINGSVYFMEKIGNTLTRYKKISNCEFAITLNISDHLLHELVIFPNPASSKITIQFAEENIPYKIEIHNLSGQLVHSESSIKSILDIDISHLSKGTYILKSVDKNSITSKKIIKL